MVLLASVPRVACNAPPHKMLYDDRTKLHTVVELYMTVGWLCHVFCHSGYLVVTRSQAVARIADRTAKNCRGHVT